MKKAFGYFAMALAGAFLALGVNDLIKGGQPGQPATVLLEDRPPVQYVHMPSTAPMTGTMPNFVDAAERTVNTVVHVTTETMVTYRDPFADFFWGHRAPTQQMPRQGAGSGVIIADDGYIVTNNHVIDGADKIVVNLNDGRQFDANVVGRDPSTDLALLKIDATGLDPLRFGNSDELRVGEWVLAIGNPMNLTSTVTAGIVSAKARSLKLLQYDPSRDIFPIESFIQTDAAVNPGNSGGALVNTSGELVGINTAIASATGSFSGYSFAIPANLVKKVAYDLLEFGTVQRAYIGVSIRDIDQALAKEMKLDRTRGVYVSGLTDGGAAEGAGMKPGDVIVKVGNVEVNNVPQLQEQVSTFRPGDKVAVTVVRGGKENVLDMTLRGREGAVAATSERKSTALMALGAELNAAPAEELKALNIQHGVKVTNLGSGKLRSSGIREGFIITRIDQEKIAKPADVERIIANRKGGVLIEGIYPNGTRAYYGLGL
jgi:serine protease Do